MPSSFDLQIVPVFAALRGTTATVQASPDHLLRTLKAKIEQRIRVRASQQRLFLEGDELLGEERELQELGLRRAATLHLTVRQPLNPNLLVEAAAADTGPGPGSNYVSTAFARGARGGRFGGSSPRGRRSKAGGGGGAGGPGPAAYDVTRASEYLSPRASRVRIARPAEGMRRQPAPADRVMLDCRGTLGAPGRGAVLTPRRTDPSSSADAGPGPRFDTRGRAGAQAPAVGFGSAPAVPQTELDRVIRRAACEPGPADYMVHLPPSGPQGFTLGKRLEHGSALETAGSGPGPGAHTPRLPAAGAGGALFGTARRFDAGASRAGATDAAPLSASAAAGGAVWQTQAAGPSFGSAPRFGAQASKPLHSTAPLQGARSPESAAVSQPRYVGSAFSRAAARPGVVAQDGPGPAAYDTARGLQMLLGSVHGPATFASPVAAAATVVGGKADEDMKEQARAGRRRANRLRLRERLAKAVAETA